MIPTTPLSRLIQQAEAAISAYNAETAAGVEPPYPQWAGDVLAVAADHDLVRVELAGSQSAIAHLSQRVDEAVALATEAIELMTRFHAHATPDDTPDMNAVFPALHFRNFVDDHARLMFKLRGFNADPVGPAFLRLKKAADEVCAVLGHHGQISGRDDRVSALMDCLYATDQLKSVYASPAPQPEQPVSVPEQDRKDAEDARRISELEQQLKQCIDMSAMWAQAAGKNSLDAECLAFIERQGNAFTWGVREHTEPVGSYVVNIGDSLSFDGPTFRAAIKSAIAAIAQKENDRA